MATTGVFNGTKMLLQLSTDGGSSYESGSVITADGPVRLDINPVAWETVPAGGTKGAVTFVYTGDVG